MGVAPQSLGNDPYRPENSPSYDWFDVALTRLEAGAANVDEALQGCPPELVDELRSLLEVSGNVLDLRHTTMPVRTVEQHRKGKADFLAEAARYRPASAAPTKTVGFSVEPILNALQTWQERLSERFSLRMPQLVPLLASVAVVAMLAVNVVQVAQAAVPGDLTYPLKDWMRDVEVRMASVEERPTLIARQEVEVRQDIEKALERDKTRVEPIEVTRRLTYYGRRGQLLDVGGLIVFDSNALTIDERNGALEPNAVVEVTFRILPGQESYVEGMRISVVATPPPPTPLPTEQAPPPPTTRPTPVPTVAREPETRCIPQRPVGWIRYRVRTGDTLSQIVVSGGGREVDVIRVNCLGGQTVYDGQTLYVLGTPGLIDQAEENEVPRPTTVPNPVTTSTRQPANTPLPTATIQAPGTPTTVSTPVDGAGLTPSPLTPTSENETSPGAGTITATPLGEGGSEATATSSGNNNATSETTPQPNTTPAIGETLDPAASPTAQGGEATPTVLPGTIEATATGGATTTTETTPSNGTPSEPATTTTPKNETPVAGASPTVETPVPGATTAPTANNATTNAPSPPAQETSTSPPATAAQPGVVTQEPNPAAPAPPTTDTSVAPVATVAPEVPVQPTPQTDGGATSGGGTDGTQSESGGTTGGGQPAQPAVPTSAPAPPAPEPIQPDPTSAGP